MRSITKSKYNASTGPIYENLGILQISKLYQLEAAKPMFLNENQHLPSPLQIIFTPNTDIHNHNTGHRNDPHISTRRTNQLSRSFIHNAPNIWYNIPLQIKETRTVGSFCQMKRYMYLSSEI